MTGAAAGYVAATKPKPNPSKPEPALRCLQHRPEMSGSQKLHRELNGRLLSVFRRSAICSGGPQYVANAKDPNLTAKSTSDYLRTDIRYL